MKGMSRGEIFNEVNNLEACIYIAEQCNEKIKNLVKCNSSAYDDCLHNERIIARAKKSYEIVRNNI